MAQTNLTDSVNLKVSRSQTLSIENHINRIRSANSKRLSVSQDFLVVYHNNKGVQLSNDNPHINNQIKKHSSSNSDTSCTLNSPQENLVNRMRSSNEKFSSNILSNTDNVNLQTSFNSRRKSHQNSVPADVLKDINRTNEKQSFVASNNIPQKRRKTSNISKHLATRNPGNPGNARTPDNSNAKKLKNKLNPMTKSPVQTQRKLTSIKSVQMKDDGKEIDFSSENCVVDFEEESLYTTDNKEIFSSETPHSLKDAVVLNWFHGLRCPFSQKEKNGSNISESKTSLVQIYKKPTKLSMKLPGHIKSLGVRNISKSPTTMERKNEIADVGQKSIDIASEPLQEREKWSSEENTEKAHDVEMHVSELNMMQITINPKSFSVDDSAVIIWVDSIPKRYFSPRYNRRLSIFPQSNIAIDKFLTGVTESQLDSDFDSMSTLKADDVYYPPITVLKNIAVDSEFDLKRLSTDNENCVYVMECSLDHIQLKANKEIQSFKLPLNGELED